LYDAVATMDTVTLIRSRSVACSRLQGLTDPTAVDKTDSAD